MLVTMKEILVRASQGNYAVGAPNVSTELDARAFIEAAEELNAPLILDVDYIANPDIFFYGHMLRQLAEKASVPVAINLDHGATFTEVYKAVQAGFTSVMIDRSACPNEKNIADTKYVIDICHELGLTVEAEIGHVGQADNYDEDRAALTEVSEAVEFIEKTGVDCLAVAIGTAHGAYPRGKKPYLDFERLAEIKKAVGPDFPLVLHGSSGTDIEDIRKACAMGINKVNISNDLCRAAATALQEADFEGNKVYDIWEVAKQACKKKMMEMIKVYGSDGKAWVPEAEGLPKVRTTMAE